MVSESYFESTTVHGRFGARKRGSLGLREGATDINVGRKKSFDCINGNFPV